MWCEPEIMNAGFIACFICLQYGAYRAIVGISTYLAGNLPERLQSELMIFTGKVESSNLVPIVIAFNDEQLVIYKILLLIDL